MLNKKALEALSRDVYLIVAKARLAGASPATVKGLMNSSAKLLKDSEKRSGKKT